MSTPTKKLEDVVAAALAESQDPKVVAQRVKHFLANKFGPAFVDPSEAVQNAAVELWHKITCGDSK